MGQIILILAIVLLVLVLFAVAWVVGIYNRLVTLRNRFKNAWAQIDVQLKRRHDLIPNLVETAKGYLKHERETLEAVIAARNQAIHVSKMAAQSPDVAGNITNVMNAENSLMGALSRLMVVAEQYPDLKANKTMTQLMEELTSTENKVSFARQSYNDSVLEYNTAREVFPNIMIAGPLNFQAAQLFEVTAPEERVAPKVSFG